MRLSHVRLHARRHALARPAARGEREALPRSPHASPGVPVLRPEGRLRRVVAASNHLKNDTWVVAQTGDTARITMRLSKWPTGSGGPGAAPRGRDQLETSLRGCYGANRHRDGAGTGVPQADTSYALGRAGCGFPLAAIPEGGIDPPNLPRIRPFSRRVRPESGIVHPQEREEARRPPLKSGSMPSLAATPGRRQGIARRLRRQTLGVASAGFPSAGYRCRRPGPTTGGSCRTEEDGQIEGGLLEPIASVPAERERG
jgi:hypothetical protein